MIFAITCTNVEKRATKVEEQRWFRHADTTALYMLNMAALVSSGYSIEHDRSTQTPFKPKINTSCNLRVMSRMVLVRVALQSFSCLLFLSWFPIFVSFVLWWQLSLLFVLAFLFVLFPMCKYTEY